jgi:hypothetical protein
VLTDFVERHGVSAHEWSVRRAVLASLPAWARERAVVDDIGNIMVEAGPQGPATVFMAHMDEVGYVIESVAPDGTVTLAAQGGVVASAWEGQTALVHFDPPGAPSTVSGLGNDIDPRWKAGSLAATAPPPLRGVFRIRSAAPRKNPGVMQAWFGLDAEGLAARGVTVAMQVTSYKAGLHLGRTRYTARSLDDRAGTTALVRAINQINPDRLPGRVIFAWSVHEEGGLRGATAMARASVWPRRGSTRSTRSSPRTRLSNRRTSRTRRSEKGRCSARSRVPTCRPTKNGYACAEWLPPRVFHYKWS